MLVSTLIAAFNSNLHLKNHKLHLVYGFSTLKEGYVCKLSPQNYRVTLYLWVPQLKFNRCLSVLP